MVTFGVSMTDSDKQWFTNVLNDVSDRFPHISNRNEALKLVFEKYLELDIGETPELETVINRLKNIIKCDFFHFDFSMGVFTCTEFFYKKKKVNELSAVPEIVIQRCASCKKGKEEYRTLQIEKKLTKDAITKILTLHKTLSILSQKGLEVKGYVCVARLFSEGHLIVSSDGLRLPCVDFEDEIIEIKDICFNKINDKTLSPPCKFLIDLLIRGESLDINDIIAEYAETLKQLPDETSTEQPIQVEVEATVIEESAQDTPQLEEPIKPSTDLPDEEKSDTKKKDKKKREKK